MIAVMLLPAPPDVSVVIPLFDARAFIGATLASVRAQTLSAREIIVVDDGSTDGSAALVETIGESMGGGHVRLMRQANAGPGMARNTGVAAARGEWVALIDADDLWRPDHLANLAAVIAAHPAVEAVGTASRMFEIDDVTCAEPTMRITREIDLFRERRSDLFNASSIAFRRAAFARTSGFGSFGAGEDTEFWIRFALDHRIAVSALPTALYRRRNGGIMDREQARMARGDPTPVSPIFETLDAALRTPAYAARHEAIRAYADRMRLTYARSLVYHGHGTAARALLSPVGRHSARRALLTALSLLPRPVLQHLSRGYSRAKRMLA